MRRGPCLGTLFVLLPALTLADTSIPDTPAGQAFSAWLEAFNRGDHESLESFTRTYAPWKNAEDYADWRAETGGYDLLDVYPGDRTNVFFHVKARSDATEEVGRVTVTATKPLAVTALGSWRMPAGAKIDIGRLHAKTRARVVEETANEMQRRYLYPETGKRMSAALRKHQSRGDYDDVRYGEDLARRLTQELRDICEDKHVEVRFRYFVRPAEMPGKPTDAESRRLAALNCEFEKAEHLPPNIGYLKFNGFADPGVCAPTATAAMNFVADSDALILDLRTNRGGNADMALFISSYLFDQPTHLADTFSRDADTAVETWTLPQVPGRKYLGKPVYLLTSGRTFSAGEALSYFLQNLKRATVIGETTAGAGHLTENRPIDDHFSVRVPYARSVSPITRAGWEGTGVEPDVKVPADEALEVAVKLATEAINRNRGSLAAGP